MALRFSSLDVSGVDGLRLVFSEGKQIDMAKASGAWRLDGAPADAAKIEEVLNGLKESTVESRVSGNAQYHDRFDVGEKGIRLTVLKENQVLHELIVGKTAGGDAVYVRLPEQDEVYVLSGMPRYTLTEDPLTWRDRAVASFTADQVRFIGYTENFIQWELRQTLTGWMLKTNRIAEIVADDNKTMSFVARVAGLRAVDFPTKEDVESATNLRSTAADVVLELGTAATFERKEVWRLYSANDAGQWLVIRESDGVGYYVSKADFDALLGDYAQTKTAVTLTEEEKAAMEPSADETTK